MKISGLQKLTLIDFPYKLACTVFLGGCDFRCPFCHNAGLVRQDAATLLDIKDFFSFLESRAGKLDGVCISGGEPTLSAGLIPFASRIKEMGFAVKLDTNGANPSRLKESVRAGAVDYVAMDIKNSWEKYSVTAGIDAKVIPFVKESAAFLLSGDVPFEFRTTVVNEFHDADDILQISKTVAGAPRYYLQAFKPSPNTLQDGLTAPSEADMQKFLSIARKYVEYSFIR